jgi:hypothetical protein
MGCYRSGTSAVGGVLHHLGVFMGSEFDPPAHSNPKGFYEDVEFKRLFEKLSEGREVIKNIEVLVRIRESEHKIWGVKDPKLCVILDRFVPLLKTDHKLITITRPEEAVCKSMATAIGFSEAHQYRPLVDYYVARFEDSVREYKGDVLNLEFYEIRATPKQMVEKIANFVGVPVTDAAVDFLGDQS